MMLDISYLSDVDGTRSSLVLNDKTIQLLADAFRYLKEKTGVYIDPYGTTRVYPDHQRILISYLTDNNDPEIKKIMTYFEKSASCSEVLIIDGE